MALLLARYRTQLASNLNLLQLLLLILTAIHFSIDIIVANYATNSIVLLLGYGDGTFQDAKVVSIAYGSHPFSLVSGDFNNDRKLDFAVANYGTDNLKIMLQTC